MAQPGIVRADRSKDAWSAAAILNAGFMHDESDQISLGIGDDVALAALDFLACVKAPWATAFRGFHRLAMVSAFFARNSAADNLASADAIRESARFGAAPYVEIAVLTALATLLQDVTSVSGAASQLRIQAQHWALTTRIEEMSMPRPPAHRHPHSNARQFDLFGDPPSAAAQTPQWQALPAATRHTLTKLMVRLMDFARELDLHVGIKPKT